MDMLDNMELFMDVQQNGDYYLSSNTFSNCTQDISYKARLMKICVIGFILLFGWA
jgi:hypothetical protein